MQNLFVLIKSIIEILEENGKFVLKRLKKYTVDEYKKELKIRDEKSPKALEALQNFIIVGFEKVWLDK